MNDTTDGSNTEGVVSSTTSLTNSSATPVALGSSALKLATVRASVLKTGIPSFRPGDTLRVHAKIVEGTRERIQIFEGVVLKRRNGEGVDATFTVRKVSYNIGVERTFYLHSPRVEKIEVVTHGKVRRAKLFYLRPLRGKATRIKTRFVAPTTNADSTDAQPSAE